MLKVLIIDDHAGFRKLLRQYVRANWPDAEITDHDPVTMGPLPENYDGAGNHIVLLDYQLGTENGLDYLRRFRKIARFPPVIMLTGEGNERLAVDAIKLGAIDYIAKQAMTHDGLVKSMREALDARGTVERFEQSEAVIHPPIERRVEIKGLRILHKLGEGGMSTVYLAERVRGGRGDGNIVPGTSAGRAGEQIVVKVYDQAKGDKYGEGMQRFSQEYDIVRRLNHPGIVRIHEQGFTDEHAFIAMEYFPGGSLRERLREDLSPQQALSYVRGVADALEIVHAAGVVHRDLKPPNIMFRPDGCPVLIDFGVAKSLSESHDITRAGLAIGTPHYMSPEQVDGQTPDARSDLYGLGVIFFEMLTGCVPYSAATAMAVLYKHKHAPIPELRPSLSALQPLVNRFLAKAPEERFQSVHEIRQALTGLPKL